MSCPRPNTFYGTWVAIVVVAFVLAKPVGLGSSAYGLIALAGPLFVWTGFCWLTNRDGAWDAYEEWDENRGPLESLLAGRISLGRRRKRADGEPRKHDTFGQGTSGVGAMTAGVVITILGALAAAGVLG